jgi:hypothetical protein
MPDLAVLAVLFLGVLVALSVWLPPRIDRVGADDVGVAGAFSIVVS